MTNLLEGKTVFLHDNLAEHGYAMYPERLGMVNVHDVAEERRLPIGERFEKSGAQIAFVHALPYIFDVPNNDILDSQILRARGVILTHYDEQPDFARFNKRLDDLGFLYIWIDDMNDRHTLASLFLKALQNV